MIGPLTPHELSQIERLPRIARARGFHLYALKGTRWLDCWADGGRALLGHRPPGLSGRLKNEIARGLYAPYPSHWDERLEKILLKLYPDYREARCYRNTETAISRGNPPPFDPLDKVMESEEKNGQENTVFWGRPYLSYPSKAKILFPFLPLPSLSDAQPVLWKIPPKNPPLSQRISPSITVMLVHLCELLINHQKEREDTNTRFSLIPSDIWKQEGPYMLFRGDDQAYAEIFDFFFSKRILIAPSRQRPSILPLNLSDREMNLLAKGENT